MDRCALFVDAGYLLADGAMAVHGTRRRESVSWDYPGLLQFLASLATEQSGLPLLRCYWYEATLEGRRSADHDVLADLPGLKLRLARMRPGRREGVESEIHRDLTTLARNRAVSDAMVVSAEEDLAQVVADVQDLGLRVSLLHIAVGGNWTISRTLRQECDDIVEISAERLRPFVALVAGAEPSHLDERDAAPLIALRPAANGHGAAPAGRTPSYAPVPADQDTGHQAPPSIYTAPVVAEYQRSAPQVSRPHPGDQVAARDDSHGAPAAGGEAPARPDFEPAGQDAAAAPRDLVAAAPDLTLAAATFLGAPLDASAVQPDVLPVRQDAMQAWPDQPSARPDQPSARPDQPFVRADHLAAAPREPQPAARQDFGPAQVRRLPTRGAGLPPQPPGPSQPVAGHPATGQPTAAQPALSVPTSAHPTIGQAAAPVMPIAPGAPYAPGRNGLYSGPQPVLAPGGQPGGAVAPVPGQAAPAGPAGPHSASGPLGAYGQGTTGPGPGGPGGPGAQGGPAGRAGPAGFSSALPAVSLAEAVQSAHEEGQEFGISVARDAPALWLEAVLARKPRMPSDLEARLLQGSALPIDYLLHDEVRHALRRGFWDAMERARR